MINGERRWTERIFSNPSVPVGREHRPSIGPMRRSTAVTPTDPIVDIRTQVTAIQKRTGYPGNTLILSKDQHDLLARQRLA